MKRLLTGFLIVCLLFVSSVSFEQASYNKYSYVFFGTFDTAITILGYARDKETFDRVAQEAEKAFRRYHRMFDQYHPYEGINNV